MNDTIVQFCPLHQDNMIITCRLSQISFIQLFEGNISTEYYICMTTYDAQFQVSKETYTAVLDKLYNA